jgi:N-acetylmuramoyl-L-alanine amidase
MMNSKINESSHLAGYVQSRIIKTLSSRYSGVKDLGVKQAPFFVLFGAKMPCVLVEVSFLSHATEGKRLKTKKYQDLLARGIAQGVQDYARKTQLTSLR